MSLLFHKRINREKGTLEYKSENTFTNLYLGFTGTIKDKPNVKLNILETFYFIYFMNVGIYLFNLF